MANKWVSMTWTPAKNGSFASTCNVQSLYSIYQDRYWIRFYGREFVQSLESLSISIYLIRILFFRIWMLISRFDFVHCLDSKYHVKLHIFLCRKKQQNKNVKLSCVQFKCAFCTLWYLHVRGFSFWSFFVISFPAYFLTLAVTYIWAFKLRPCERQNFPNFLFLRVLE